MLKPLLDLAGCGLVFAIIFYPSWDCERGGMSFPVGYHFITEPPYENCWIVGGGLLLRFALLGVVWFSLRRALRPS